MEQLDTMHVILLTGNKGEIKVMCCTETKMWWSRVRSEQSKKGNKKLHRKVPV